MASHQNAVISLDYKGHAISYQKDGWFNATEAAAQFGKKPNDWLRLPDTNNYIGALCRQLRSEKISLLKVIRGGRNRPDGTWLHPKLAVPFARWLDDDFAVWCDAQIDNLIHGKENWHIARHAIASSSKVLSGMLQEVRKAIGKATAAHHHMNEHKLINSLLTGEYRGLNRELMTTYQLDFLAHFELRNAVLIGMGLGYDQRKGVLITEANAWKESNATRIEASNDFGKLVA